MVFPLSLVLPVPSASSSGMTWAAHHLNAVLDFGRGSRLSVAALASAHMDRLRAATLLPVEAQQSGRRSRTSC
jgi:hypothetical protein